MKVTLGQETLAYIKMRNIVQALTYKPGYTFTVHSAEWDKIVLTIKKHVNNANKSLFMQIGMSVAFVMDVPLKVLLEIILDKIVELERMEAREWFSYKGVHIFDEHHTKSPSFDVEKL